MNELTLLQPTDIFSQLEPTGRNLPAKYGERMNRLTNTAAKYMRERSELNSVAAIQVMLSMGQLQQLRQAFANTMTPEMEEFLGSISYSYMVDIAQFLQQANNEMVLAFKRAASQPDDESFLKELGRLLDRHFSW